MPSNATSSAVRLQPHRLGSRRADHCHARTTAFNVTYLIDLCACGARPPKYTRTGKIPESITDAKRPSDEFLVRGVEHGAGMHSWMDMRS